MSGLHPDFEAGLLLADYECQHGRLSGDCSAPCGCWFDEPAPVRQLRPVRVTTVAGVLGAMLEELAA